MASLCSTDSDVKCIFVHIRQVIKALSSNTEVLLNVNNFLMLAMETKWRKEIGHTCTWIGY
jgi:hypothetical protein